MSIVGQVLYGIVWVFIAFMFVRFVVDWVQVFSRQWSPNGPLLVVLEGVYSTTDPPIKALRRWIKPIRIGSVALDLSFLLVLVAAYLLLQVIALVFLG